MSPRSIVGDIITDIRQAAELLGSVYPLPDRLDDEVHRSADAAVEGVVIAHYQGEQRITVVRPHTNWHLDSASHVQGRQFLYRTAFIGDLAAAYHVLGDERYADAARDYLAGYMNALPLDTLGRNQDTAHHPGVSR